MCLVGEHTWFVPKLPHKQYTDRLLPECRAHLSARHTWVPCTSLPATSMSSTNIRANKQYTDQLLPECRARPCQPFPCHPQTSEQTRAVHWTSEQTRANKSKQEQYTEHQSKQEQTRAVHWTSEQTSSTLINYYLSAVHVPASHSHVIHKHQSDLQNHASKDQAKVTKQLRDIWCITNHQKIPKANAISEGQTHLCVLGLASG
jgi:hypothetical protein